MFNNVSTSWDDKPPSIAELRKQISALKMEFSETGFTPEEWALVGHPNTIDFVVQFGQLMRLDGCCGDQILARADIEFIRSEHIREFIWVWEFPQERFFTYEARDEEWCRYFGIGGEVETKHRALYMVRKIQPQRAFQHLYMGSALPRDLDDCDGPPRWYRGGP